MLMGLPASASGTGRAFYYSLDDGKSYRMNAETDIDSLKVGMDIVIAYDVTNGENVVTDMELPDSESGD